MEFNPLQRAPCPPARAAPQRERPEDKAEREERERRITAKFAKWKQAVEVGKDNIEREYQNRVTRYQLFEDRAASATNDEREAATKKFIDEENRRVAAKCRTWSVNDFASYQVLGKGAFGVVHLVKHRATGRFYALKQMNKARYHQKNRDRVYAERDVLAEAQSRWCVELYATFQDANHIYMLMEFLQGGDLIFHLSRKGRFSKRTTAFYMAELLEALDAVHKCGFVHRDVKPDNIVISTTGHLKLLDFGLCKYDPLEMCQEHDENSKACREGPPGRARLWSVVGTPQYMAPEAFRGQGGPESDIWSLGIITYECLVGDVPFHPGTTEDNSAGNMVRAMRHKIESYAKILPERLQKCRMRGITTQVEEGFLSRTIRSRERRLSIEQCRADPFFAGIDFPLLHLSKPPFVPQVGSPTDTTFFEAYGRCRLPQGGSFVKNDVSLDWAHYEFDREAHDLQRPDIDVDAFFAADGGLGHSGMSI